MERELFTRYEGNPIIISDDVPYPSLSVLNPGAAKLENEILLLLRVENTIGYSHLTIARSKDGETNWIIDSTPTLMADENYNEAEYGLEDPRITWIEKLQKYVITCVSFSGSKDDGDTGDPPGISFIGTKDFLRFERIGQALLPSNKDACLFPETFDNRFALIHRPVVEGKEHVWVSFSKDLKSWGGNRRLILTRNRCWDADRVGLSCPPIKTAIGWLIIYHGTRGGIYRIGLALLSFEDLKVIRRSKGCVFAPKEQYERVGNKSNVVFPCGCILVKDKLSIYYGAADSTVCLATASLKKIMDYLMECPAS